MSGNIQRRFFLKQLGVAVGAVGAIGVLSTHSITAHAQRRSRKSDGELPLVEPGKGVAVSVSYVNSISDVKEDKLKVVRQGVPFKDQSCANCGLYKKTGEKDGKEVGTCTLFPKQLVYGKAWCTSWVKI